MVHVVNRVKCSFIYLHKYVQKYSYKYKYFDHVLLYTLHTHNVYPPENHKNKFCEFCCFYIGWSIRNKWRFFYSMSFVEDARTKLFKINKQMPFVLYRRHV